MTSTTNPEPIDTSVTDEVAAPLPSTAALKLTLAAVRDGSYEPNGEEAQAIVHAIVELLRDCSPTRVLH